MQEDWADIKKAIKIVKKSNWIDKLKIAEQTDKDPKHLEDENLRKNLEQ